MDSNLSLLKLPYELVLDIFDYVPNKSPLKLTCKIIYEIVCQMEAKKHRLTIGSFGTDQILDSDLFITQCDMIIKSTRMFDEVKVKMWAHNSLRLKRLKEVFTHQQNMCKLYLRSAQISEKKLIKLLSLLPHLEDLNLELCLTKVSKTSKQRLSHLKKLKSFKCSVLAASIIFELRNDVLKQLIFDDGGYISQLSTKLLVAIFNKQKNIEELTFNPQCLNTGILLPQLKKLRMIKSSQDFHSMGLFYYDKILRNHSNLLSLTMQHILTTEEFLIVCNLTQLKSLEMKLENVEDEDEVLLRNMNRLRNLKELRLDIINVNSDFGEVILPLLENLKLQIIDDKGVRVSIEKFPKNFPCLKELRLASNSPIVIERDLPILLQNKNLVKLDVHVEKDREDPIPAVRHEKLKEVHLGFHCPINALNFILQSAPNLQKLHVTVTGINSLRYFLTTYKKLTHVKIYFQDRLTVQSDEFIELLKEQGKNLKYFECAATEDLNLGFRLYQRLKTAFHTQFAIIDIKGQHTLMRNVKWN